MIKTKRSKSEQPEIDKRPDPKPRKHALLWNAYLLYDESMRMRIRHTNRISSIHAGKSNLDANLESAFLQDTGIETVEDRMEKMMIAYGKAECGEIWDWVTSIKGLKAGSIAAQLLALIDDIGKFDNISKLWRFAGQAVFDGKAERLAKGDISHFNARLKKTCFLVCDQFIKQQTPLYADYYYEEKRRLRMLHPEPVETGRNAWPKDWTDNHVHRCAMRKTIKLFLSHLWVTWRTIEGLPVTDPYVKAIMGHDGIIDPPAITQL